MFQIILCFGIAILTKVYIGYAVLALVVEINSVFLHMRQLLQCCGFPRTNSLYRLNSLINLGMYSSTNNGNIISISVNSFEDYIESH